MTQTHSAPKTIGEILLRGEKLTLGTTNYENGAVAVIATDKEGMPVGTLSVNLPESKDLPDNDHFFLRDWAESERLAEAAIDAGLIVPADDMEPVRTGFVFARPFRIEGDANYKVR
jgi:hypothetical protein